MANTIEQDLIEDFEKWWLVNREPYMLPEYVKIESLEIWQASAQLQRERLMTKVAPDGYSAEDVVCAKLPNGKTCTNVYDAYKIGLEQAAQIAESINSGRGNETEIANAIRALIQPCQLDKVEQSILRDALLHSTQKVNN